MWMLQFLHGRRKVYLLTGKVYSIGRKDTDIVIPNDNSISRKHTTIEIKPSQNESGYQIILTDYSKFGLFYARGSTKDDTSKDMSFIKVVKQKELQTGDVLRIGLQNSLLRLVKEPLTVVTSTMNSQSVQQLQNVISLLGGRVVTVWGPEVTHLVTQKIVLNLKVSQALACAYPIVTAEYFNEVKKVFLKEGLQLPETNNYLPAVNEQGINENECSFFPNLQRKMLFNGKTFVFLSKKQYKRLSPSCELAGGLTTLINADSFNLKMVRNPQTCVIFCPNVVESQIIPNHKYENLQEQLIKSNFRFIKEHEISLSLLYISTEVYCNPTFELDIDNSILQQQNIASASQVFTEKVEVNETLDFNSENFDQNSPSTSGTGKRKRSVEENITKKTPSKSVKTNESMSAVADDNADPFFSGLTSFRKPKKRPPPKSAPKFKKENPIIIIDDDDDVPVKKQQTNKVLSKNSIGKPTSEDCNQDLNTEIENGQKSMSNEFKFQPMMESTEKISDDEINFDNFPDSCISDDSLWACRDEEVITKPSSKVKHKKIRLTTIDDAPENFPSPVKKLVPNPQSYTESASDGIGKPKLNEDKPKKVSTSVKVKQENLDSSPVQVGDWINSVPSQVVLTKVKQEEDNKENFNLVKVVEISLVVRKNRIQSNSESMTFHQGKNFKKFRKVLPTYMVSSFPQQQPQQESHQLPRIIGGSDLIRHENRMEGDIGSHWEVREQEEREEDFGFEFSQDSNPFRKTNNRNQRRR